MKKLLFLIILAFVTGGYKTNEVSFEHATYDYPEFGITFKYPKEWIIKDDVSDGNFILALSKDGKGFGYPSSMKFYGTKPKDMDFINRLLEEDEYMQILDEKQIIINNLEARQVTTEIEDDGAKKIEIYVIFEDKDKSLIVISGGMTEEDSERNKMFFEIVSTIKFIAQ